MSTLEPNTPFEKMATLMRGYVSGQVPLASVVTAIRQLPPGTSGDFASALAEGDDPAAAEARIAELLAALRDADRAG
jgi:hypothetical protein